MLEEFIKSFWEYVRDNTTPIFMVGAICLLLGLGLHYGELGLSEQSDRYISIVIGVSLILYSSYRSAGLKKIGKISDYGIVIEGISDGDTVKNEIIRGKYKKLPPSEYKLFVIKRFDGGGFIPLASVEVDQNNKSWSTRKVLVGTNKGSRQIGIYLVGPDGQKLLAFYERVVSHYDNLSSKSPAIGKLIWPTIKELTSDMQRCHEVRVILE